MFLPPFFYIDRHVRLPLSLAICFILFFILLPSWNIQGQTTPLPTAQVNQMDLKTGWHYRWGDSPRNPDGTLSWLGTSPEKESSWLLVNYWTIPFAATSSPSFKQWK